MAYINLAERASDEPGDRPDMSKLMAMLGPGAVDQAVRQAIQYCWMMLPSDKQTSDELEVAFRRIVDRAIQNFREDSATFRND